MLTVFGIDHSVGADMYDFKELCPAFIQQSKSGACKESNENNNTTEKHMGKSKLLSLKNCFHWPGAQTWNGHVHTCTPCAKKELPA